MSLAEFPKKQPAPVPKDWHSAIHDIKLQLGLPITEGLRPVPTNPNERKKLAASIDLDGFFNYLSKIYEPHEMLLFADKVLEILKREDSNPLFLDQPAQLRQFLSDRAKFERMRTIVTSLAKLYASEPPINQLLMGLDDAIPYQHVNLKEKLPITLELLLIAIKSITYKKFQAEMQLEQQDRKLVDITTRQAQFDEVFEYLRKAMKMDLMSSISIRECENVWFEILNKEGPNLIIPKYDLTTDTFTIKLDAVTLNKIAKAVKELGQTLVSQYYTFRQSKNGEVPRFILESLMEWCLLAQLELMQQRKRGIKVEDQDLETIRFAYEESQKVLAGTTPAYKSDYAIVIHGIKGYDAFNGIVRICEKYGLAEFKEDDTQIPRNEIKRLRQYVLNDLMNAVLSRNSQISEHNQNSNAAKEIQKDLKSLNDLLIIYENGIMRWTGTLSRAQYFHQVTNLNSLAKKYNLALFVPSEESYSRPSLLRTLQNPASSQDKGLSEAA